MVKVYRISTHGEQFLGQFSYGDAVAKVVETADDATWAYSLHDGNFLSGEYYPADAVNQLMALAGKTEGAIVSVGC